MEIRIKRRKKIDNSKSTRSIPIPIIFFLSAIFLFSTFNLIRDLGTQEGIRPFGFISEIIAQAGEPIGDVTVNFAANIEYDIKDNIDRCLAMNPATGQPIINSSGKSSSITGKAGVNQGGVGNSAQKVVSFVQGENSTGQDLGMGYVVSIFTSNNPGEAIGFITETVDAGMIPIVRLCFPNGCNFNLNDNSIVDFYQGINKGLPEGYEAVVLVGPNEPSTDGEMTYFGIDKLDYRTMYSQIDRVAAALQDTRVVNGGRLYLAPVAFNLINTLGDASLDDFKQMQQIGLNYSNFDYLIGNIYDSINNGWSTYDIFVNSGVKAFTESNGLKFIFTEFGVFDEKPESLVQARDNFRKFCDDDTVDGISFFRSFEELPAPTPKPTQLETDFIAELSRSCLRSRPWLNCNFDSAIYPDNPEKVSLVSENLAAAAPSCIVNDNLGSTGGANVRVVCDGGGCTAKILNTIQAELPIKHFGSNSSFGTNSRQYTPISAQVASYLNDSSFDALNQFAGELKGGGISYPMPNLGSAINSASQLILYSPEYQGLINQSTPSPGSFASNIDDEIITEIDRNIGGLLSYNSGGKIFFRGNEMFTSDERIVNVNGSNLDKKNLESVKRIQSYNPIEQTINYEKAPNSCSPNLYVANNSDDYIVGPEVVVGEKTVWSGSGSDICRIHGTRNNQAQRNTDFQTSNNLNCSIVRSRVVNANGVPISCAAMPACNFQQGNCNIPEVFTGCLEYQPSAEDRITYSTREYASIPNFQITDIWDAMYRMYENLQNKLAGRGLKIIFQENIGMKAKYNSIIRDGNRPVSDPYPYLYSSSEEELAFNQNEISGTAFEPDLFENNFLPSRGKSARTSQQYYDWIGNIDIMQEINVAYTDSSLPGEREYPNPFYQTEGPLNDKEKILLSGFASQILTFPLITCDQVTMCKNKAQLIDRVGETEANVICPFSEIQSETLTCIARKEDERFEDLLKKQLCIRGYKFNQGECGNYQCKPGEPVYDGINNDQTGTGTDRVAKTNSGISKVFEMDKYEFVASTTTEGQKSIDNFANQNNVDFAINTNFYSRAAAGFNAPEGLVGGKGDIKFNTTSRTMEVALVFHNGNPTGGNPNIQVLGSTDKLAVIDISNNWGGDSQSKLSSLAPNVTIAISGLPLLVSNGVAMDTSINYGGITGSFVPRTIVGWDKSGNLVMAILDAADLVKMVDAAQNELGLQFAIGLDGGGSSQFYSRNGFDSGVNTRNLTLNNTVYSPSAAGGGTLRNVVAYLGARDKSGTASPVIGTGTGNQGGGRGGSGSPPILNISLNYPLERNRTPNSGYGCAFRRGTNLDECHTGLDFGSPSGTPILAAAPGKVIYAGVDNENSNQAYGNMVRIEHSTGVSTLYAHMLSVNVSKGDTVQVGDVIGFVGSTGNSTGPHLHFELRINSTCVWDGKPEELGKCTVDPTPYLTTIPISIPSQLPRCVPPSGGDSGDPYGVLSCSIEIYNTQQEIDWVKFSELARPYIRYYNTDNNNITWIGHPNMVNDPDPANLPARIQVTEYVINRSIELGLNPVFVLTTWIEETWGSAVGSKALGCGVYLDSYSGIPYNSGPEAMIAHMEEQITCYNNIVKKTANFNEFVCTYSGEPALDGYAKTCGEYQTDRASFGTIRSDGVRSCNRFICNPNYPVNLCKFYNFF